MGDKTRISWSDATWNCLLGCSRVSRGCLGCYAIRDVWRMAHNPNPTMKANYADLVEQQPNGQLDWTGVVRLIPDRLEIPLHWQRPRRIFVNSLSDVFHESVSFDDVDRIVAVMARCHWHIFQVLTKRPERMAEYLATPGRLESIRRTGLAQMYAEKDAGINGRSLTRLHDGGDWTGFGWPLPNVWWGTSTENQPTADERIPHLLRCRPHAAVLWLSMEPLVGPVDLRKLIRCSNCAGHGIPPSSCSECNSTGIDRSSLDWIVVGGESGPTAAPMHPDWPRSLRDQAVAAGIGFEYKQWGEYEPAELYGEELDLLAKTGVKFVAVTPGGVVSDGLASSLFDGSTLMVRVGKRTAGRLLDGVEWNDWPRGTTPFAETAGV